LPLWYTDSDCPFDIQILIAPLIYRFWLPLWYTGTDSDCPFDIQILITSLWYLQTLLIINHNLYLIQFIITKQQLTYDRQFGLFVCVNETILDRGWISQIEFICDVLAFLQIIIIVFYRFAFESTVSIYTKTTYLSYLMMLFERYRVVSPRLPVCPGSIRPTQSLLYTNRWSFSKNFWYLKSFLKI
jgi:hypothetical protein